MSNAKKEKVWNKTRVQGLMRHKSGGFYARLYVGGKEKWISLRTTVFEVAKRRLETDPAILEIRGARARQQDVREGRMTVGAAQEIFLAAQQNRAGIKESTRAFAKRNLEALMKSWPELRDMDVRQVSENECQLWAARMAAKYSAAQYNILLALLRRVFDVATKAGILYRNPTQNIERKRQAAKKLTLPTRQQFADLIQEMRTAGHRLAEDSADLAELLAYSGCRIGEARLLTWEDIDEARAELCVRGEEETGTKNWGIRRIPLFPALKDLLARMRLRYKHLGRDCTGLLTSMGRIDRAINGAAKRLKIVTVGHHDLRHYFATICIESGVDIPTLSRWLGHQDGGALALKTYGHLRDEHSQSAALKVDFSIKA